MKDLFRGLANVLDDAVAMDGAEQQCSEDQEIECSGKDQRATVAPSYGRDTTI
jgi:hypothetical protein